MLAARPAFTLLELVVYTVLFSIFSLVIFSFLPVVYAPVKQSSRTMVLTIANHLACDLIRKDVMSSSKNLHDWDSEAFVFKKETLSETGKIIGVHIGFEFDAVHHYLRRSEGVYDFAQRRWVKRSVSFFGCQLSGLTCQLETTRVLVKYHDQTEVIALRNRVLS